MKSSSAWQTPELSTSCGSSSTSCGSSIVSCGSSSKIKWKCLTIARGKDVNAQLHPDDLNNILGGKYKDDTEQHSFRGDDAGNDDGGDDDGNGDGGDNDGNDYGDLEGELPGAKIEEVVQ